MRWCCRSTSVWFACVLLAAASVGGCSSESEPTCTAGTSRACACPSAAEQGTQQCGASGWGSCLGCTGQPGPTPTSCTPNASEPCTCAGGTAGIRFCQLDGQTWSDCGNCGSTTGVCTPSTSGPCTCADGKQGAHTCAADGLSWGTCVCGSTQVCTPSSTEACPCGYNKEGRRTCSADGKSWGDCVDCVSTAGPTESDCGDKGLTCNKAIEVCVLKTAFGFEYACEPLPAGCDADRSCGCVSSLCSGIYDTCKEWEADNTVACDCSDCGK